MTPPLGFSPSALESRLGPDLYAACVRAALDAPAPSPDVIERVRLLFAPGLRALSSPKQHARAA